MENEVELNMEKATREATKEFYDLWLESYKATFGRLLEMPALGPTREKSEDMMKGLSMSMNLYTSWMETNSNLLFVFMEAMRKTYEKTATAATEMEGEIDPEKYKDFYKIWIETYSETFKDFFRSEQFASDLGRFMSSSLEFQKHNQEMLEENYLKPMNLPTKAEIDELNKEVYSLKKKVKELASQVKELSKERMMPSSEGKETS